MYQLKIKQRAKKQLAKIPKIYQDKILAALPIIQQNPFHGKKLGGKLIGAYSYRVWPYRIIYRIYKNLLLIIVIRIGHRQGVY
ncbi:type II toxin-antitoxin system RelE/ParE family toxin [Patescibacteria group bacterium]|nr:type II toxin-antitoxin system RelE/ParE family toxin [Patescibacteria group bacterium]